MKETAMPPYPWQKEVWGAFCERLDADRLPHALLLHGMEGLGVEGLSHSMVRYMLCHAPLEDVACGRCKGCQLLSAGSHPDLFVLKREEATQIKVDQVRSCVEFVSKTSHFDHMKVVLVEEADRMNLNAANALLKSLEEPQGRTVFILVTSHLARLLATVRSRCQSVHVKPPSESTSLAWLHDQSIPHAQRLLRLSGGAPLKAKLWSDSDFVDDFEKVNGDLLALISGEDSVFNVSKRWQKFDLINLLDMQVLVLDTIIKSEFDVSSEAQEKQVALEQKLSQVDTTLLFRMRDGLLAKVEQARSFSNLNGALVIEELTMDWFAFYQILSRKSSVPRALA